MKLGWIISFGNEFLLSTEFCLVHPRRMGGAAIGCVKCVWGREVTRLFAGARRCPQSYPSSIAHEYPIIRRPHVPGGSGSQPTRTPTWTFDAPACTPPDEHEVLRRRVCDSASFSQSEGPQRRGTSVLTRKVSLLRKIGSKGAKRIKNGSLPNFFSPFFISFLVFNLKKKLFLKGVWYLG